MAEVLTMPEVAAGLAEAVLADWMLEVGADVRVGDVIATVETDKAVVDIESDQVGTLAHRVVAAGATVAVGAPIGVVTGPDDAQAGLAEVLAELGLDTAAQRPGSGPSADEPRIFSSPLARRLARDAGIGLRDIRGTGPGGRIRRLDVERTVAERSDTSTASATEASMADTAPYRDEPHSRLRRTVAERLVSSKQEAPHFYLRTTCRVDGLLALRAEINEASATKISVNDFVLKAVAVAHRDIPELNVTWTPHALRYHDRVDIGVAIAAPQGLVVPIITELDCRSLGDVASAVRDLRGQAESGTLRQHQLEGGSISVSNLGMYGVEEFAAIINPPHAAVLAVGAICAEPVVDGGTVVAGSRMRLTLSVDHRPVDGAAAARWLARLRELLEKPLSLLI